MSNTKEKTIKGAHHRLYIANQEKLQVRQMIGSSSFDLKIKRTPPFPFSIPTK
jgi:hypothetical protein